MLQSFRSLGHVFQTHLPETESRNPSSLSCLRLTLIHSVKLSASGRVAFIALVSSDSRPKSTSKMGEEERAGKSTTTFRESNPVSLSWHNISVTTTKKKGRRQLLNDVNGVCEGGELMALMGASGAGKTTLLNTLLARNLSGLSVDGKVLINGYELKSHITSVSGYAQQEDLFMSTLTVREHLMIQARLRMSGEMTAKERSERVTFVLKELGLTKCSHTRIGVSGIKKGISGGEGKRVTIAAELLTNPPLLFCDEPTTGLDSYMAEAIISVLKKLARSGKTIICTIHQPSWELYNMFDKVCYLAAGRVAFMGAPKKAIDLMEACGYKCPASCNPADMIIETLAVTAVRKEECLDHVNAICDKFADSEEGKAMMATVISYENSVGTFPRIRDLAPVSQQLFALQQRALIDNWRNPSLFRLKVIQKVIMGLFVGTVFFRTEKEEEDGVRNLNGGMFYIVAELTYSTVFGILTFMPDDYPILQREYHDGLYSVGSYYSTRALSYVPLFTLDGALMMGICYWMVGFYACSFLQIFLMFLTALLVEQSASSFGVMLSTVSPSYPVAVSFAGPILTLLSLTGGMYTNIGKLPTWISWVQYGSWFRYGFEGFVINQWTNVSTGLNEGFWTSHKNDKVPNARILDMYSFDRANIVFDMLMMVFSILIFYLVGYFGLYFRVSRSR
ncbi:hypothetical protein L596_017920 [Steinernema carpocapsae]|uniref:ABC transporter domain-containing protein n=1 Tax=Steinernema carpocapsae TaxID=34508 RepID=A0A4U5N3W9_STECR|nr:hypothetical protein L596_017920 [Steinernema carpocapsae]